MARIKYGFFLEDNGTVRIYYEYPQKNVAAKLLDKLIKSRYKYYFTLADKAEHECITNKDITYDSRLDYKGGKGPEDLPPEDFDGYVIVAKNCIHANNGKIVSLEAKVFHELWEVYFKVDKGMQYKEAHNKALDMEALMMEFDPTFTEGSARGELDCLNCKYNEKTGDYVP